MATNDSVLKARIQLMLNHPFLASAIAAFPIRQADASDWCETMATDGAFIYYNISWCEQQNPEELQFVVAHEVWHCLFGHIDRRGERDPLIWNLAIDYVTNLFLVEAGLQMPTSGLFETRYKGMIAEEVYERLVAEHPTVGRMPGEYVEPGGAPGAGGAPGTKGFDKHLAPDDWRASVVRATAFPTVDERRRIRQAAMQSLKSNLPGKLAGLLQTEVTAATTARIDWKALLSRFVNGLRRSDYSMNRFNKKHLWRGIYLPSIGVPGPEHLVVVVDTSGSMTDRQLSEALAEIEHVRLLSECRLTLIQCDAAIQKVEEFDPLIMATWDSANHTSMRFHGRGGTDLRPPFEWIRNNRLRPDALIYMTDGYGPFPTTAPDYPVLWVLTRDGVTNIPFGSLARL